MLSVISLSKGRSEQGRDSEAHREELARVCGSKLGC